VSSPSLRNCRSLAWCPRAPMWSTMKSHEFSWRQTVSQPARKKAATSVLHGVPGVRREHLVRRRCPLGLSALAGSGSRYRRPGSALSAAGLGSSRRPPPGRQYRCVWAAHLPVSTPHPQLSRSGSLRNGRRHQRAAYVSGLSHRLRSSGGLRASAAAAVPEVTELGAPIGPGPR
jgi:hypothetical protein